VLGLTRAVLALGANGVTSRRLTALEAARTAPHSLRRSGTDGIGVASCRFGPLEAARTAPIPCGTDERTGSGSPHAASARSRRREATRTLAHPRADPPRNRRRGTRAAFVARPQSRPADPRWRLWHACTP